MPDLWPDDIAKVANRTPVTILREQASLLGQKTQNLVKANVEQVKNSRFEFHFRFYLIAPALQNYRFKLFDVHHSIELYPMFFDLDDDVASEFGLVDEMVGVEPMQVEDEEQLLDTLKRIFAAKKTRRVVASMLGQSQETDSKGNDYATYEDVDVNDIPF